MTANVNFTTFIDKPISSPYRVENQTWWTTGGLEGSILWFWGPFFLFRKCRFLTTFMRKFIIFILKKCPTFEFWSTFYLGDFWGSSQTGRHPTLVPQPNTIRPPHLPLSLKNNWHKIRKRNSTSLIYKVRSNFSRQHRTQWELSSGALVSKIRRRIGQ